MATVEDILRQTGFSDDQIKAMDGKAITAFSTVLTTAEAAQRAADAAKVEAAEKLRLQSALYENEIVPALNNWGTDKANLEATVEFYRKQNEAARTAGFIPKDAPGYTAPGQPPTASPARDPGTGQYVPGANPVPGSPGLDLNQITSAISNAQWFQQEYFNLNGRMPPDAFGAVWKEATDSRMPFQAYVEKKYDYPKLRTEAQARRQKEHDDAIVKETEARLHKEYAERGGSNPMVRVGGPSQYAEVRKGIAQGTMRDPLTLNKEQRHQQAAQMIDKDLNEMSETAPTVH
jgi:hypothetical protein